MSHLEAFAWIIGLAALACMPLEGTFSLCPLHNAGFDFCPGCGLGHAIHHAFRAELLRSWTAHPLGIPAIGILMWRIFVIFRNQTTLNHKLK